MKELPKIRKIERIEKIGEEFPTINQHKIGIFIGSHEKIETSLLKEIDEFCEKYNAVVICDHTSKYNGKYKILANIIYNQERYDFPLKDFDLLIHIGNVSGAYINVKPKEVWRVNPDGEIRDTFKKLKYVFQMEEIDFFKKYNSMKTKKEETTLYTQWKNELEELEQKAFVKEFPFSNIWVAQNTIKKLPDNCTIHLGILNSLRSWNFFDNNKNIYGYTNTGGFGIDGMMSSLIGASLVNKDKLYFGVVGDLGFFYDLNSLGNRKVGNNIRLILINNGCGTEFHNYSHPASVLGNEVSDFIAADGHFGNKSKDLVKHYVKDLGFEYLSAENKEEFLSKIDYFTSPQKYEKSIVFEIFTDAEEESKALESMNNLKVSLNGSAKKTIKKMLSPKTKKAIKKLIHK